MGYTERLKCPSCGSGKVSSISGINYQCDACSNTFIFKQHPVQISQDSSSLPANDVVKPKFVFKKLLLVISGLVGMGIAGLSAFLHTTSSESKTFVAVNNNQWGKPNLESYNCFAGSKGATIWLILKKQTNVLDSVSYTLRILNPETKQLITEEPVGKPITWKDKFNQYKRFDTEFYALNDTLYNVSEEGGLQGFDLYSGKKLIDNTWLEAKFTPLKDGIVKTEKQYYKKRVKIRTVSGDDFFYHLNTRQLLSETESDNQYWNNYVISENIYLTNTLKSELYLCTAKRNEGQTFYIETQNINYYLTHPKSTNPFFKTIKKKSDSIYPKALPIMKYNNDLLFFYASNFSKKANGILALVAKDGSFRWQNNDSLLKKIVKENANDNFYINYQVKNNLLVINYVGANYQSMGVNLVTGKTQFVFNQSYIIN
jgi:hypothetical protein